MVCCPLSSSMFNSEYIWCCWKLESQSQDAYSCQGWTIGFGLCCTTFPQWLIDSRLPELNVKGGGWTCSIEHCSNALLHSYTSTGPAQVASDVRMLTALGSLWTRLRRERYKVALSLNIFALSPTFQYAEEIQPWTLSPSDHWNQRTSSKTCSHGWSVLPSLWILHLPSSSSNSWQPQPCLCAMLYARHFQDLMRNPCLSTQQHTTPCGGWVGLWNRLQTWFSSVHVSTHYKCMFFPCILILQGLIKYLCRARPVPQTLLAVAAGEVSDQLWSPLTQDHGTCFSNPTPTVSTMGGAGGRCQGRTEAGMQCCRSDDKVSRRVHPCCEHTEIGCIAVHILF